MKTATRYTAAQLEQLRAAKAEKLDLLNEGIKAPTTPAGVANLWKKVAASLSEEVATIDTELASRA